MDLAAGRRWLGSLRPDPRHLRLDATGSLPVAISSVPDGMAAAALIGVNPVHGLYATVVGPIAGGLTLTTSRVAIATTTASALAAGSALAGVPAEDRAAALFLLTLLAGVLMIGAGLARLGRYTRFVSHSVMAGFLTGVSVSLVLGQVGDFAGTSSDAGTAVRRFVDIVAHPGDLHLPTLAIGVATIVLLVVLSRTPIGRFASIVAIALPALVVVLAGLDEVALVSDGGDVPLGLPWPALPDLRLFSFELLAGAGAVAVIVLVQGFGVAQSVPEPNRRPTAGNGDFIAQGVANVAAGLFRGQPVGGSVGQTAMLRSLGGRSRWGGILIGVWMAMILLLAAPVIGYVPTSSLAAVLIYAGITSIRPELLAGVWRTSTISRVALLVTLAATLAFPVPVAVGIGVAVSLLLQLNQEAMDLRVVELVRTERGVAERPAPATLPDNTVTVLAVHGSLYFAGARTLEARLPDPGTATRPVVVLRLRGRMQLGATALMAIGGYADRLAANGGRLYLSGVGAQVMAQLGTIGVSVHGPVSAVPATEVLGESTHRALDEAETWLVHGTDAEEEA